MYLRQAHLTITAATLRRRIFASLPRSVRVAHLFSVLSASNQYNWAVAMYGIFGRAGISEMPEIKGQPFYEWMERAPKDQGFPRIPTSPTISDAKIFGEKAWKKAYATARQLGMSNPVEGANEALQATYIHFHQNWRKFDDRFTLHQAENYVIYKMKGILKDWMKTLRRRGEPESLTRPDDEGGGEVQVDVEDTSDLEVFEDYIIDRTTGQLHRDLQRLLQRSFDWPADEYVMGLVLDYGTQELVGDTRKGKPALIPYFQQNPTSLQNFSKNYQPKVLRVLEDYIRGAV